MSIAYQQKRIEKINNKVIRRQERIKDGTLRNPTGYRWSTADRKREFLVLAREEELQAKGLKP